MLTHEPGKLDSVLARAASRRINPNMAASGFFRAERGDMGEVRVRV